MSLALSTLLYEWRRYLAAVIALAVAGLLVLSMAGMFAGMVKSFAAPVDHSPAEIMILPPEANSLFDHNSGQPRRLIPSIYRDPDVLEVQALNFSWGFWSNFPRPGHPDKASGVQVIIIDAIPGSVTLPTDLGADVIEALQQPLSVAIDRSSFGRLGVSLGEKAKINGRTVWVRATTTGYASMFNAMVFMSRQTARLLGLWSDGPRVGPLVVKIRNPPEARRVVAQLNAMSGGKYKAWSREELAAATQKSMLQNGGIAVMVGFAVVVGAFIGIVITWQTLRGAVLANAREFASLRAVGVSMGSLRRVVMELSLWVGIAGLGLTAALAALVWVLANGFGVPMDNPPFLVIPVAISQLGVAVLAGTLSLGVLKKSQPMDLLR
jgi:putative ABC transport system permease protein